MWSYSAPWKPMFSHRSFPPLPLRHRQRQRLCRRGQAAGTLPPEPPAPRSSRSATGSRRFRHLHSRPFTPRAMGSNGDMVGGGMSGGYLRWIIGTSLSTRETHGESSIPSEFDCSPDHRRQNSRLGKGLFPANTCPSFLFTKEWATVWLGASFLPWGQWLLGDQTPEDTPFQTILCGLLRSRAQPTPAGDVGGGSQAPSARWATVIQDRTKELNTSQCLLYTIVHF